MTPSEFKAWFDGFTEALQGTPSEEQWKRIKARVAEIDGRPITEHIYIQRYLPYYYGVPYYGTTWGGTTCLANGSGTGTANIWQSGGSVQGFNSQAAMLTLGRAEAQSLKGCCDGISG